MKRITFLKNKEPYGSLELAKQALNAYASANSLLDGEPIIGRYNDEGKIKLVLGICTVLATSERGCVTSEKLTFFINEESIDSLRLENLTDVYVLSKLEGDVLFYDGEKWVNKPNAVFDENYVHTDNNYTSEEKEKLRDIQEGAEVNVQSDWAQTETNADNYIKNKPTIGSGVLTIKKNNLDSGTQFSANSTTDTTANLDLATVATSGDYNDLSNKPDTIRNKKGTFVSGIIQIEVPFKSSEFGDYPILRAYNNWSVELIGETSYTDYADLNENNRKATMKLYSNGVQTTIQENGFYILGA